MERVVAILRALLSGALREHEGAPPALTDITIERACGPSQPRLVAQFSNGHRTAAALAPSDCYAFCDRHCVWDLESLRRVLLREAQRTYTQMLEEHATELRLRQRRAEAVWRSREPRRINPLLSWFDFGRRSLYGDDGSKEAEELGIRLLTENLTAAQREQYTKHRYFDVLGGNTGKRFRIRYGRSMNIDQLDKNGRRVCAWCFFPEGGLVVGDIMLAQKIALEVFESEALKVANRVQTRLDDFRF